MSDERPSTPYQRPAGGSGASVRQAPRWPRKRRPFQRRKVCRFCAEKNLTIDYKEPRTLRYFISEARQDRSPPHLGNCAKHQREITEAIKRARNLALLPIASNHVMS